MQFRIKFSENITLTYDLVKEEIVDGWVEILKTRTINDLCPFNHYIGYVSDNVLNDKINRLYQLADYINLRVPNRVIKAEINKDTYQHAINTMHVHFPELKNDEKYKEIWSVLSEYNDMIHWIESTVKQRWGNKKISESGLFRITLDFNKSNTEFRQIPEPAYKLFDPDILFGELKIHYTHVGRNSHELFITNDTVCPKDQFVPQHLYTASVRMYFTDDFYTDYDKWKHFYQSRGKDFWGLAIDDPKIAFGYMKIGQLSNITIDNNNIPIPITPADRHEFRQKLVYTKVLGWDIIKGAEAPFL